MICFNLISQLRSEESIRDDLIYCPLIQVDILDLKISDHLKTKELWKNFTTFSKFEDNGFRSFLSIKDGVKNLKSQHILSSNLKCIIIFLLADKS